jgi:hypothetical protein
MDMEDGDSYFPELTAPCEKQFSDTALCGELLLLDRSDFLHGGRT